MEPADVEQLVAAAQANLGYGFEGLYRLFAPAVQGYLRSQGSEDAEGVTSEVFLAAFRRIRSFRGDASGFRSWLFTIAHHRMVDERRRRSRTVQTQPMTRSVETRAGGDVEEDAFANLGAVHAVRLLETLSPDQRDVLTLRLLADLTVEETAHTLGKPAGAVKALQRRGLAALRRRIEDRHVTL